MRSMLDIHDVLERTISLRAYEFKVHIFNPFFTTKPVGKGTGLGLSLSRDIIEKHGGKIYAERGPGDGAKFIIELPARTKT